MKYLLIALITTCASVQPQASTLPSASAVVTAVAPANNDAKVAGVSNNLESAYTNLFNFVKKGDRSAKNMFTPYIKLHDAVCFLLRTKYSAKSAPFEYYENENDQQILADVGSNATDPKEKKVQAIAAFIQKTLAACQALKPEDKVKIFDPSKAKDAAAALTAFLKAVSDAVTM